MTGRGLLIAVAAAVLALPTVASGASTRDAITGGGQAFFGSNGETGQGAGDTVAFSAKRAKGTPEGSTDAVGQIQVNRRTTTQVKFHGTFHCLVVNGEPNSGAGMAWASGESRDGTPFQLYVEDGGKGQMERNDMITLLVGDQGRRRPVRVRGHRHRQHLAEPRQRPGPQPRHVRGRAAAEQQRQPAVSSRPLSRTFSQKHPSALGPRPGRSSLRGARAASGPPIPTARRSAGRRS